MRLVLDTNIVVSALLWKGAPRRLLRAAAGENVFLFFSPPLLDELTDVLSHGKFKKQIAALCLSSTQLVETYARRAEMVEPTPVPRVAPDPDDDVVIGTALAAKADLLVTGDRALLSVAKYEGLRIVTAREASDAVTLGVAHEERR